MCLPLAFCSTLAMIDFTEGRGQDTSTHCCTHGRIAAHTKRPTVAKMKMKTTASSFVESLWKQVVKTSSGSASLHIARLASRQNCLVHCPHMPPLAGARSLRAVATRSGSSFSFNAMIVLFEKHVHLQNDVGALEDQYRGHGKGMMRG